MKITSLLNILPDHIKMPGKPIGELFSRKIYAPRNPLNYEVWYQSTDGVLVTDYFQGKTYHEALMGCYHWCIENGYLNKDNREEIKFNRKRAD